MNLDKKEILIKLENVGIFQDNKWLVHDVSLEIERGKILTQNEINALPPRE